MIWLGVGWISCVIWLCVLAWIAPEAYEDDTGFYLGRKMEDGE